MPDAVKPDLPAPPAPFPVPAGRDALQYLFAFPATETAVTERLASLLTQELLRHCPEAYTSIRECSRSTLLSGYESFARLWVATFLGEVARVEDGVTGPPLGEGTAGRQDPADEDSSCDQPHSGTSTACRGPGTTIHREAPPSSLIKLTVSVATGRRLNSPQLFRVSAPDFIVSDHSSHRTSKYFRGTNPRARFVANRASSSKQGLALHGSSLRELDALVDSFLSVARRPAHSGRRPERLSRRRLSEDSDEFPNFFVSRPGFSPYILDLDAEIDRVLRRLPEVYALPSVPSRGPPTLLPVRGPPGFQRLSSLSESPSTREDRRWNPGGWVYAAPQLDRYLASAFRDLYVGDGEDAEWNAARPSLLSLLHGMSVQHAYRQSKIKSKRRGARAYNPRQECPTLPRPYQLMAPLISRAADRLGRTCGGGGGTIGCGTFDLLVDNHNSWGWHSHVVARNRVDVVTRRLPSQRGRGVLNFFFD